MAEPAANKLVSVVLIPVFVAVGILGVLLPILPGIPFLLVAAIMASRHSPALKTYLEGNRHTARSMRQSQRFSGLSLWGKVQVCVLGALKVTLDMVEWGVRAVAKVFGRRR